MQEIIIHNWDELQRVVFDDVWDDKIMRYRDNRIYRGMAEQSWDLIPSLNRVCGHDLSLETQFFAAFGSTVMRSWPNIPGFGSCCRSRSTTVCRRACSTGHIHRSSPPISPRRTRAAMTATA